MFKDFMNNDCGGGNSINKFTNQIFENRIGSQQQENWHEELQNFNMEKPLGQFGEVYNNNNQIMRFDNQRERMFELGGQSVHPNEKMNQFYFSEDEMMREYQQFRPKQRHQMRSNNMQQRKMNEREEWSEDYHQMEGNQWTNEYHKPQQQDWHEEYNNEWSTEYQSNLNELDDEYERVYNNKQDGDKDWTSEYEEYNMEKAFEDNQTEKQEQEDDDWFNEYLQNEKQFSEESMKNITQQLLDINDPKLQSSNFMKFIEKVHTGEFSFENNNLISRSPSQKNVSWADDYQQQTPQDEMIREYQRFQNPQQQQPFETEEMKQMVNEFENFRMKEDMVEEYNQFNTQKDQMINEYNIQHEQDEDYDAYDEIWGEEGGWNVDNVKTKQYQFSKDNPYMHLEHPYEKGIELMDNGRIKDAILAFEAEVTKNPENVKAWHMLGKAHAEGDKDDQAIEAIKKAIKLQPDNLESYIDIAVSFTNTMHKDKALQSLEQWLSRNSKYREISEKFGFRTNDNWLDTYSGMSLKAMYERHDYVANAFIEAARLQPNDIDPDIQIILGLLYNISMDYDKAIECFRAALFKKPEDYTLWNKLGATLANNNKSDEAVDAYLNALEQKPLYVRAIANLGISFVALNKYEDAAKQFLSALSLEPSAKHIWSNLENSFSFMDRHDLIDKIGEMNPEVFRKYIDF